MIPPSNRREACHLCEAPLRDPVPSTRLEGVWIAGCIACNNLALGHSAADAMEQFRKAHKTLDGKPRLWLHGHPIQVEDEDTPKPEMVLCVRVADMPDKSGSKIKQCHQCGHDVWRDEEFTPAPPETLIICSRCLEKMGQDQTQESLSL